MKKKNMNLISHNKHLIIKATFDQYKELLKLTIDLLEVEAKFNYRSP